MPTTDYERRLRRLLRQIQGGTLSVSDGLSQLRELPFSDLTYAKVDHHRLLRRGFPEVVYGEGKTVGQVVAIAERLVHSGQPVVITRATAAMNARLKRIDSRTRYHAAARVIVANVPRVRVAGCVAIVTAGTTDIPIAAEAKIILELMGRRVIEVYDVGVAGLHRLIRQLPRLKKAQAIIVVAGMEGALPSVVAGLVAKPVIAVPTSVGYGASFRGLAPLLTMLNSCAPGIAVVNIDNGFGAGYFAGLVSG